MQSSKLNGDNNCYSIFCVDVWDTFLNSTKRNFFRTFTTTTNKKTMFRNDFSQFKCAEICLFYEIRLINEQDNSNILSYTNGKFCTIKETNKTMRGFSSD